MGCGFESHGGHHETLGNISFQGFSIPAIFWLQTQLVALTLFAPQTRIVTSSSAPVNTLPYYRRTRLPARQNLHPPEESSHWQTPNVQNPQSVEQSSRKPVFQRDKTPSHWRKRDANRPLSVRKTPVSGGINPLVGLSTSRFLQPVEESTR